MSEPLFDDALRALRRQRAQRQGGALFLAERLVEELSDRLSFVQRRFRRALVIGLPDEAWAERFCAAAEEILALPTLQDLPTVEPGSFDLCVVVGELDTANDLPLTLHVIRAALKAEALVVGAFAGNDSLPALRSAMLAADQAGGAGVSPRVHPRINASTFATLLQDAGFIMPVVDIDRVRIRYATFDALVRDLRGMGATNLLLSRSRRPLTRAGLETARETFASLGDGTGTVETVELIHFAAWTGSAAPAWQTEP